MEAPGLSSGNFPNTLVAGWRGAMSSLIERCLCTGRWYHICGRLDVALCYGGGTKAEVGLAQGKRVARGQDLDLTR